jgi:trehalose/maltose hydrolase-like predicted phosphorylase
MAGTIMIAITAFAGVDLRGKLLSINPSLPERWKTMRFGLKFKGVHFIFEVTNKKVSVVANKAALILMAGKEIHLKKGEVIIVHQ